MISGGFAIIFVMMRRVLILSLALLYSSLSVGISLDLHYCGGKLASVSIALPIPDCCCGPKNTNKDCCEDAQLDIQMEVDQAFSNLVSDDSEIVFTNSCSFQDFDESVIGENQIQPILQANPPPKGNMRILMGSLTFYG